MTRLLSMIPASLALLLWAGFAQAAPVRPELSVEPAEIIQKVHGTHRACRYSPALDWWHRHVGPYNRAVSCGGGGYYYDPYWYAPYYGPGITLRFGRTHRFHRGHRGRRR